MNRTYIALLLTLLGCTTLAHATSVVRMSLPEVADLSGQIVVGEIASVESYWASHPRRIESRITLHHAEFLKGGDSTRRTLSFTVPGGTVGSWQARIAGAPEFRTGTRWAVCLLPTWKSFPTAGVHQGAFQLTVEGGVIDGRGQVVRQLDDDGFVVVGNEGPRVSGSDFIQSLRTIAAASAEVSLPDGAPIRVIPTYRSTPFKPAATHEPSQTTRPEGIQEAASRPRSAAP